MPVDRRNSNPAALIPDFLPFLRRLEMAVVAFHTFFLSFSNRTPTRFEKLHNFSQYRFRARKFTSALARGIFALKARLQLPVQEPLFAAKGFV